MFIGAITIAAGLLVVVTNVADEATTTINEKQSDLTMSTQTSFTLTSVSYNSGTLRLYAQNTGEREIRRDTIDLFINGERVSRTSYTQSIEEDTKVSNTESWSPEEVLYIEYNTVLENGRYTVLLNAESKQKEQEISV